MKLIVIRELKKKVFFSGIWILRTGFVLFVKMYTSSDIIWRGYDIIW